MNNSNYIFSFCKRPTSQMHYFRWGFLTSGRIVSRPILQFSRHISLNLMVRLFVHVHRIAQIKNNWEVFGSISDRTILYMICTATQLLGFLETGINLYVGPQNYQNGCFSPQSSPSNHLERFSRIFRHHIWHCYDYEDNFNLYLNFAKGTI